MYNNILSAVDNSEKSGYAVDAGIELGKKFSSSIIGIHVTNPGLHDESFRKMEDGLPEEYQDEEVLEEQRDVHDDLITKGLRLISESYLDSFKEKTVQSGLENEAVVVYGKNFEKIVEWINKHDMDLAVFGDHGLGKSPETILGSVTERVTRRTETDLLIQKKPELLQNGKIIVAFDSSEPSYRALKQAIVLADEFDADLEVVHVFDPYFHRVIFKKLVNVLSEDAASVFNFEEQQDLHDNIIDKGLKKVGVKNLKFAEKAAERRNLEINTQILAGKEFQQILERTREINADLLVLGRYGKHVSQKMDIGSTTENLARLAPCNVLVVNNDVDQGLPTLEEVKTLLTEKEPRWTPEAENLLSKAPKFVQGMARQMVNRYAKEQGIHEITPEMLKESAKTKMPAKMVDKMFEQQ